MKGEVAPHIKNEQPESFLKGCSLGGETDGIDPFLFSYFTASSITLTASFNCKSSPFNCDSGVL